MDEEIALIVVTALLSGTILIITLVKMIIGYLKSKNQATEAPSSLTTGELYELIQDAVAEATEPLTDRVDALEQRAQALPPGRHDFIEEAEGYTPEAVNAPQRRSID